MKSMHRVLAGTLAAVMLIPALSPIAQADAPKVSVDEAVYVNMDYYGKPGEVSIVKGCSLNGNSTFTDYGSYGKVTNMTDEVKPTVSGDSVSWKLPDGTDRFYYECDPKSGAVVLPWTFDVSYKLNGVPADAKKLAGASGMVEITVHAIPNKSANDYSRNNMLLQVGTAVNMKDNLSLEAPGAQLQSLGDYKAALFAALPGEDKTFTIRIGTKSFELDGIVMMMVPGTLEQMKDIKDIKDATDTVQGSMDSAAQGTNELLSTLESMTGGLQQAKSGLASLDSARNTINSSKDGVYNSADKSLADLTAITNQTSALVPHLQKAQSMVVDVNSGMNAMVARLNTVSTQLTDLSVAIGDVRSDVNDLRDVLDDAKDNTWEERDDLERNLKNDMATVKADETHLQQGIAAIQKSAEDLTKQIETLQQTLKYIVDNNLADDSAKQMITLIDPTITSLTALMETMDGVTTNLAGMLNQTDQFLATGDQAMTTVDAYMDELDDGIDATDDLLKDANRAGSSLKNILSGSQDVIGSVTDLNGIVNRYQDDTVNALQDTEKLMGGLTSGLTDAKAFLTSLETVLRTSGGSLNDGTRKTLSGLIDVMEKSLNGMGSTATIKNATNTIQKTVDDKIDKYKDDNNFLNLDAEAKPISFTSSKNTAPDSIQAVLRTEEISVDKGGSKTADMETADKDIGVLARMRNVFAKIWEAIVSAFSGR
jgi:hypothetical protein